MEGILLIGLIAGVVAVSLIPLWISALGLRMAYFNVLRPAAD